MLEKIQKTVELSSDVIGGCVHCGERPCGPNADLGEQINHYLGHGYKLLHVGQQTTTGGDGKPWQSTIAILGK